MRSDLIRGALFVVLSELCFTSAGAAVKAVASSLPVDMVVFFRNLVGLALLLPIVLGRGLRATLATRVIHLHLLRAVVGVGGMYCFFYALAHLPLANGMLLKMTAPIFMPLIAWLWLREQLSVLVLLAVPAGFAGVALVIGPQGEWNWLALVGLAGGALAAGAKVTVRRLTRSEPAVRVVFYFAVLAALISALPLLWSWRTPGAVEIALLLAVGMFATAGQLLLTRGYAEAPASRVGPFTYVAVIFAAGYGYLFWGETLDLYFVLGAALIALAGVLAIYVRRPRTAPGGVALPVTPD